LLLDQSAGAPVLNIFGGKITTYRRLAQSALAKVGAVLPVGRGDWTAGVALPGGDFPHDGVGALTAKLAEKYPFLTPYWAARLVRAYGTEAHLVLGNATTAADLGTGFGATLTEAELQWLVRNEYARTAEDVLWRRTKLGLRLDSSQVAHVAEWMSRNATT
jgi:glycerol-3-phosphate dehydrogenase